MKVKRGKHLAANRLKLKAGNALRELELRRSKKEQQRRREA